MYAVMYLLWSGFLIYGLAATPLARIIMLFALCMLALLAGRSIKAKSWEDVVPYSLSWVVTTIALDALFAGHVTGPGIFLDPNLWFGYLMIAIIPLAGPYTRLPTQIDV